ncbi:hypothetical protein DNTS_021407 [Danionella cerebrum]|uniref:Cardiomyopathy-associated protein 5 n=1 Tax=Danionella cerebrum TaxID=2873325 RepID=A0A553R131_9TELE|nr:hypothetical protein DNTS_021407 [Danionella translucida]
MDPAEKGVGEGAETEDVGSGLIDIDDEEEIEELHKSLQESIQDPSVKPKLQCLMVDPSFSMVTVQSEDSGIVWETASSRCSTPWASEGSSPSEQYSLEGSGTQGNIVIIMDEEKIKRKKTTSRGKLGDRFKKSGSRTPRSLIGEERPAMIEVALPNVRSESSEDGPPAVSKDQDLFTLISEGFEILNIVVPSKLATVDEEESTGLEENLAYLDITPKIKSKPKFEPTATNSCVVISDTDELNQNKILMESSQIFDEKQSEMEETQMDYLEKFTLYDEQVPSDGTTLAEEIEVKVTVSQEVSPLTQTEPKSDETADEDSFEIIGEVEIADEHLDEVFYGSKSNGEPVASQEQENRHGRLSRQSSKSLKESGSVLFGSQECILTPVYLPTGPPKIIDQILLEEPRALSFHYSDLYEDALGDRKKEDDLSDTESVVSERSFKRRYSDSDDGDGYLEKFILKDETPAAAHVPEAKEEESGGKLVWPQSKFELTLCLERVAEEKDDETVEQHSVQVKNESEGQCESTEGCSNGHCSPTISKLLNITTDCLLESRTEVKQCDIADSFTSDTVLNDMYPQEVLLLDSEAPIQKKHIGQELRHLAPHTEVPWSSEHTVGIKSVEDSPLVTKCSEVLNVEDPFVVENVSVSEFHPEKQMLIVPGIIGLEPLLSSNTEKDKKHSEETSKAVEFEHAVEKNKVCERLLPKTHKQNKVADSTVHGVEVTIEEELTNTEIPASEKTVVGTVDVLAKSEKAVVGTAEVLAETKMPESEKAVSGTVEILAENVLSESENAVVVITEVLAENEVPESKKTVVGTAEVQTETKMTAYEKGFFSVGEVLPETKLQESKKAVVFTAEVLAESKLAESERAVVDTAAVLAETKWSESEKGVVCTVEVLAETQMPNSEKAVVDTVEAIAEAQMPNSEKAVIGTVEILAEAQMPNSEKAVVGTVEVLAEAQMPNSEKAVVEALAETQMPNSEKAVVGTVEVLAEAQMPNSEKAVVEALAETQMPNSEKAVVGTVEVLAEAQMPNSEKAVVEALAETQMPNSEKAVVGTVEVLAEAQMPNSEKAVVEVLAETQMPKSENAVVGTVEVLAEAQMSESEKSVVCTAQVSAEAQKSTNLVVGVVEVLAETKLQTSKNAVEGTTKVLTETQMSESEKAVAATIEILVETQKLESEETVQKSLEKPHTCEEDAAETEVQGKKDILDVEIVSLELQKDLRPMIEKAEEVIGGVISTNEPPVHKQKIENEVEHIDIYLVDPKVMEKQIEVQEIMVDFEEQEKKHAGNLAETELKKNNYSRNDNSSVLVNGNQPKVTESREYMLVTKDMEIIPVTSIEEPQLEEHSDNLITEKPRKEPIIISTENKVLPITPSEVIDQAKTDLTELPKPDSLPSQVGSTATSISPLEPVNDNVFEIIHEGSSLKRKTGAFSQLRSFTPQEDLSALSHDPDVLQETAEDLDFEMVDEKEARECEQDLSEDKYNEQECLSDQNLESGFEFVEELESNQMGEYGQCEKVEIQPMDMYCLTCHCPMLLSEDKHQSHEMATLEEGFESVKENFNECEKITKEHNEEMVKLVMDQYNEMSQALEEEKKAKLEQLYDQIVSFQENIDKAKETLEMTAEVEEEMDSLNTISKCKDFNLRLRKDLESTMSLEMGPRGLLVFEDYAKGKSGKHGKNRQAIPVPQKPHLQPQEANSATSTSVTVYWKVNEGDIIDCFQVYCMEEPQGAISEEYRVTVKESYCNLEELEPNKCYKVWVMAVNYTGCSMPSERLSFRTAPSVPVMHTEQCTVLWDAATLRWSALQPSAVESFTLEYCRQCPSEREGLRSISGIKGFEQRVSLQPNDNYLFYIKSVIAGGASEQSEAALISTRGTRFHFLSETASSVLKISEDRNSVEYPQETYNNMSSVIECPAVMGELLSSRGFYYWETEVLRCKAYRIGIAYHTTAQSSTLGEDDASWCLHCVPTSISCRFELLHQRVESDIFVMEVPVRIGSLLDFIQGRLCFFNAQNGQLLGTFRNNFTEPCHPVFVLEQPGSLTLKMTSEVPQFAQDC